MDYYQLCLCSHHDEDLLTGILAQWPFESFMDTDKGFSAYIPANGLSDALKQEISLSLKELGFDTLEFELIKGQNWNAEWEKNFKAVTIHEFCHIRADFHPANTEVSFDLVVNPKMAFGTGHHETTWMMIDRMAQLDFQGKSVFDYGTGTGVLAILAHKLGAQHVASIDYDINSVENARENAYANGAEELQFQQCELKDLKAQEAFDVILANINYPVLLENAVPLAEMCKNGSMLLLSGILLKQVDKIIDHYAQHAFRLLEKSERGDWACLQFISEK